MRSLELAIKHLAGERLQGTAAERAALSTVEFDMSDWKQIAKTTKDENDPNGMSVSFPDRDNIMLLVSYERTGATADFQNRLGDSSASTGTNYAGLDIGGNFTSQNYFKKWNTGNGAQAFEIHQFRNKSGSPKMGITQGVIAGSTGDNAPHATEAYWVWHDNAVAGYYEADFSGTNMGSVVGTEENTPSEVVVLGYNDGETASATNQFWTQLTSKTLDANSTTISTDEFAAYKYLRVRIHMVVANTGGNSHSYLESGMYFNDDNGTSDSNYTKTVNEQNATYSGSTGKDVIGFAGLYSSVYVDCYILNIAGKEKVCIFSGTGTGGDALSSGVSDSNQSPMHFEGRGKWRTTSGQITKIHCNEDHAEGTFKAGTNITVWGANTL